MKKVLSVIFAVVLLISLTSCGEPWSTRNEKNSLGIDYVSRELTLTQFDTELKMDRSFSVKFDIIDLKNEHFKLILNQEYLDFIGFSESHYQAFLESDNEFFSEPYYSTNDAGSRYKCTIDFREDDEIEFDEDFEAEFGKTFSDIFEYFPTYYPQVLSIELGFAAHNDSEQEVLDKSMETFGYFDTGYERWSLFDYIGYVETGEPFLPVDNKIILSSEFQGEKSPALIVDYSNNEMDYGDGKLSKLTPEAQEFFGSGDFIRNVEFKDLTK